MCDNLSIFCYHVISDKLFVSIYSLADIIVISIILDYVFVCVCVIVLL